MDAAPVVDLPAHGEQLCVGVRIFAVLEVFQLETERTLIDGDVRPRRGHRAKPGMIRADVIRNVAVDGVARLLDEDVDRDLAVGAVRRITTAREVDAAIPAHRAMADDRHDRVTATAG